MTGNASEDFDNITEDERITLVVVSNTNPIVRSDLMSANGWTSGWDLKAVFLQYDWENDRMYVGFDCWSICGDADGNGDAGASAEPSKSVDLPNLEGAETIDFLLWPSPPITYAPTGTNFKNFRPNIVVGVSSEPGSSVDTFGAYLFDQSCPFGTPPAICPTILDTRPQNPGNFYTFNFTTVVSTIFYSIRFYDIR